MKTSFIYLFSIALCLLNCSKTENSAQQDSELQITSELKRLGIAILTDKNPPELAAEDFNQLTDSLLAEDSVDRVFYFKVINKARSQATGESLEFIHWKVFSFSEKYPNEFFNVLSDSDLKYFAKEIGELIATEEESPQDRANEYIDNLNNGLDVDFQGKLSLFITELHATIDARKQ